MPDMDINSVIGVNIQRIRRSLSVTQEELHHRTGLTRGYLSKLEKGDGNPTVISLQKIADALDVTLEDLVRRQK